MQNNDDILSFLESLNDEQLDILLEARNTWTGHKGTSHNPQFAASAGLYDLTEEGMKAAAEHGTLGKAKKYIKRVQDYSKKPTEMLTTLLGASNKSGADYASVVRASVADFSNKFGFRLMPKLDSNGEITSIFTPDNISYELNRIIFTHDNEGNITSDDKYLPRSIIGETNTEEIDSEKLIDANEDLLKSPELLSASVKVRTIDGIKEFTIDELISEFVDIVQSNHAKELHKVTGKAGDTTFYSMGGGGKHSRVSKQQYAPILTGYDKDGLPVFNIDTLSDFDLPGRSDPKAQQVRNADNGGEFKATQSQKKASNVKTKIDKVVSLKLDGTSVDEIEQLKSIASVITSRASVYSTEDYFKFTKLVSLTSNLGSKNLSIGKSILVGARKVVEGIKNTLDSGVVSDLIDRLKNTITIVKTAQENDLDRKERAITDKDVCIELAIVLDKFLNIPTNEDTTPGGVNRLIANIFKTGHFEGSLGTTSNWITVAKNLSTLLIALNDSIESCELSLKQVISDDIDDDYDDDIEEEGESEITNLVPRKTKNPEDEDDDYEEELDAK